MAQRSEDELGDILDRSLADSALKTISGFGIGVLSSLALFKGRRTWPIWLGSGIGIGMGWGNFRHELNKPYALHGTKVKVPDNEKGPAGAYRIVVQQNQ